MANGIPLLWHGSPERFESFGKPDPLTRLSAVWTAADPLVAALYAGPGGWVLPVVPAGNAAVLDASGWPGVRPLHWLDATAQDALAAHRVAAGIRECGGTPFGDSVRTLAFSLWPGYGGCGPLPSGVCWEGVIQEDGQDDGDMNALLRHAGFDAVLCVDPLPGIVGDIERRLAHTAIARFRSRGGALIGMGQQDWIRAEAARPEAGAFRAAAASLERIRRLGEPPAAVAFLDPAAAAVVHSRAVPASAVLAAPAGSALRRPAPLADIQAACSQGGMACPPRSRATVRHG